MKRRRFLKHISAVPLIPAFGTYATHFKADKEIITENVANFQASQVSTKTLSIGTDKQLFVDEHLIAINKNVTLTMNPPRKTGEANIIAEHPWEDFYAGGWNTVVEDDGLYKMWYDSSSITDTLSARKQIGRFVCYATSRDGIQWEKPVLGLLEFQGSKKNNILLRDTTGAVFLDPNKTGGDKYKYVGWWMGDGRGFNETRVWIFTSPDGIKWKPFGDQPIMVAKSQFDTQNQIFWDDRIGKYVAYVRHNEFRYKENKERYTVRKTHRAESDDLSQWPKTTLVFAPDEADPPFSDHYNIGAIKYPYAPNVYFGFPSPYLHTNVNNRNDGPLDIQLITSRDGISWNRLDRRPYVRLGIAGSYDSGSMYMTVGMLRKGDELWMYYTGYDFTHGGYKLATTRKKGVVSRLVQRLDGFISADSAFSGGELRTVPMNFAGSRLTVNVDTGAMGLLRVEILDKNGRPIPGFTEQDCDMVNGNYIDRVITWNGKSDVSTLRNAPVQLRFAMRSTKLYAFQFLPDE